MVMRKLLSSIILGIAITASCTDYKEPAGKPSSLSVDGSALTFEPGAGSQVFTVSSGEEWQLSALPDWLSVNTIETSGSSPQKVKWGDTNCDQQIDVSDAVLLSRFVAEDATANLTAEGKANAEVTGDGVLTGDDTVKILKYIAKLITDEEFAPAK